MKLSFFSLWKLAKFLKKHKSVVLQNLHQYSVLSNITSLYFFNSIGALKCKISRPWSVCVKIRHIPHVRFETTSETSSSNCTSFFIFMTHNSSVYFKQKFKPGKQLSVSKTSWRRLGDKQNVYWGYVFNHGLPANLNQYLTNLYLLRRLQDQQMFAGYFV